MPDNKPPIGSLIDWGHSQSAGLKMFHVLNESGGIPLDIVNDRRGTIVGVPTWQNTPGGIARGGYGTAAYDAIDPPQQVFGVTFPCFMAAGFCNTNVSAIGTVFSQSSTASNFPMVMITLNSDAATVLAVGSVWFRLRDQVGTQIDFLANPASVGININDGMPHSVAIRALSASSYEGWVDGRLMGTSTTTLGAMTCERYSLGVLHRSSVTQPFLGQVLWNQAGSGATRDMELMARDPFAAIQVQQTRRYFASISAGSSFRAAWAARSNIFAGSGIY